LGRARVRASERLEMVAGRYSLKNQRIVITIPAL
jgi:hypothetical protein